jgi:16S rRNA (guanine527-N7)-methyltransferase
MDYPEFNARFALPEAVYEKLRRYHDLLLKWQAHLNLIAPGTVEHVWERHIADSLALLPYIRDYAVKQGAVPTILDIGAGAGFPGLVLAICEAGNLTLVESDRRKCEFLREAARITGVNVQLCNNRVETLPPQTCDILASRATAGLSQLMAWAVAHMHAGSICLFHKGANWATEWNEAEQHYVADLEVLPSASSATGCIIKLTNIKFRPR